MCGRDVYKNSGRAFCPGGCDMRRSVPRSLDGHQDGHLRVRVRGVHVVDDV